MKYQILISSLLCTAISIGNTISLALAQSGQTNAKLKGTVIYPSEFLPAQKVCARNTQTKSLFCTETRQGQKDFTLPVSSGSYEIFARECNKVYNYNQNARCRDGYRDRQAYYNEVVRCGLTFQCTQKFKKNRPIVVKISSGQTIGNIKPHDWYSR